MNATVRPIRSFVLRQGRFSPAQQRAYEALMPRLGVPYQPAPLNLEATFGRNVPTVLEIGFGMGETTARIAPRTRNGISSASRSIPPAWARCCAARRAGPHQRARDPARRGGSGARHDPAGSLAGIHVFFPDPWPKKRHHKRRLMKTEFVELLASRLSPAATCTPPPTGRNTPSTSSPCSPAGKSARKHRHGFCRGPPSARRPSSRRAA